MARKLEALPRLRALKGTPFVPEALRTIGRTLYQPLGLKKNPNFC